MFQSEVFIKSKFPFSTTSFYVIFVLNTILFKELIYMNNILFINSCVRNDESRTLKLSKAFLNTLSGTITSLNIENEHIQPLNNDLISKRDIVSQNIDENSDSPLIKYALQFASADTIVIAAPYWDLAFPAVLKAYLENICVCGVTFKYSEEGIPVGLCKAKKLYYITTSGGYIGEYNMGYDYIKALCKLYFGITDTECISAEGLDIFGNDTEKILAEKIRSL